MRLLSYRRFYPYVTVTRMPIQYFIFDSFTLAIFSLPDRIAVHGKSGDRRIGAPLMLSPPQDYFFSLSFLSFFFAFVGVETTIFQLWCNLSCPSYYWIRIRKLPLGIVGLVKGNLCEHGYCWYWIGQNFRFLVDVLSRFLRRDDKYD